MDMWIWVAGVIAFAVGLMVGIEMLMARLGIRPAAPEQRSGGIRDVAERVNRWAAERKTDR